MSEFERTFGAGADVESIISYYCELESSSKDQHENYEWFLSYEEACEWSKNNNGAPFTANGEHYFAELKLEKPHIKSPIYENCDLYEGDYERLFEKFGDRLDKDAMMSFACDIYGMSECCSLELNVSHLLGLETALAKHNYYIVPASDYKYMIVEDQGGFFIRAFLIFEHDGAKIISSPEINQEITRIITTSKYKSRHL